MVEAFQKNCERKNMKELYLVSKSSLFEDYRKNIAIFKERKLAEEYVSKQTEERGNLYINAVPFLDDYDPKQIVIRTIISTKDGEGYRQYAENFKSDIFVCNDSKELQIFEKNTEIIDKKEVRIVLVTNRCITDDEIKKMIKDEYKKNYENLLQSHNYNIGDEVIFEEKTAYVIYYSKILSKLRLFLSDKTIKLVHTSQVVPTGRFSSQIKEMFDENRKIKVD
jgi:hypothetical protein